MPAVEEIAQSNTGLRHLRIMTALTELEQLDSNRQVGVSPLYKDSERFGLDRQGLSSDLDALQDRGWIWFERSAAGIGTVIVAQPGVDAAEEFKELKNNPRRRVQEIRDAILNWLYDLYLGDDHAAGISDFLTSDRAHFFGEPYTEGEFTRAVRWLRDEEYVKGIGAFGGELVRPELTAKAIRTIETGKSVNELLTSAGVNVTEVHVQGSSGVNVAVDSSNVTQSNTLTQGQIDQVEKMLGSVRAMLTPSTAGVSDDVAAQAEVITGQLEEEIKSSAPQPTVVKALGLRLMELAATGTVQGVVDALNTVIAQGINGIG